MLVLQLLVLQLLVLQLLLLQLLLLQLLLLQLCLISLRLLQQLLLLLRLLSSLHLLHHMAQKIASKVGGTKVTHCLLAPCKVHGGLRCRRLNLHHVSLGLLGLRSLITMARIRPKTIRNKSPQRDQT